MRYERTIEMIKRLVVDGTVPGVSYAMLDLSSDQIMSGIYGNEALVPDVEPLRENQLYDVASLTKVVGTTNVILQLIEQGKLRLTDSISQYLPEWRYPQVTVRHLLTHTSGITGYIKNRNQLPKLELKKALLGLHVGNDFDQQMTYSDINFIFLGWIASAILNQPIQDLISSHVLQPLKMTDSTFYPTNPAECVPTEVSPERGLIRGHVHDPKAAILGAECGSAGLFATKQDLLTFAKSLLTDDETLLSNETKDVLAQNNAPNAAVRSLGWALIPSAAADEHLCIWHSGFTGTAIVLDRQTGQGLVFLSNRIHPDSPNEPFLARRYAIIQSYLTEKEQ
ncbi:serine hydrolase domain-containing protein [Secundilactobacillus oryzae]|nr:serine hydrolase domain-containing protein [Secundilactobacillus oryzae]